MTLLLTHVQGCVVACVCVRGGHDYVHLPYMHGFKNTGSLRILRPLSILRNPRRWLILDYWLLPCLQLCASAALCKRACVSRQRLGGADWRDKGSIVFIHISSYSADWHGQTGKAGWEITWEDAGGGSGQRVHLTETSEDANIRLS